MYLFTITNKYFFIKRLMKKLQIEKYFHFKFFN